MPHQDINIHVITGHVITLTLNLDSGPCQAFLQLLASDLSFQKDKSYLSKCKALTMKYSVHAVGKPLVYCHRPQLVCEAEMIHSSP